jgi:hypothetical protein
MSYIDDTDCFCEQLTPVVTKLTYGQSFMGIINKWGGGAYAGCNKIQMTANLYVMGQPRVVNAVSPIWTAPADTVLSGAGVPMNELDWLNQLPGFARSGVSVAFSGGVLAVTFPAEHTLIHLQEYVWKCDGDDVSQASANVFGEWWIDSIKGDAINNAAPGNSLAAPAYYVWQ